MGILADFVKRIVRQELQGIRLTERAMVTAIHSGLSDGDRVDYACDVRLEEGDLVLENVPIATQRLGTVALPNPDDWVLLAFEQGNLDQPIIIGRLYDGENRAPPSDPDQLIFRLPLAGDDDASILAVVRSIQADTPSREIRVDMSPNIRLRIVDGTVRVVAGETAVTLSQAGEGGGRVTLEAGRNQIVLDQEGAVTLLAQGSVTLRSLGDLRLEGRNVTIRSAQDTNIEAGMRATLEGRAGAIVDGGLSSTLEAQTVSILGLVSFSPS
jgi:hypothetical protein